MNSSYLPSYTQHGYFVVKEFCCADELQVLHQVISTFHSAWLQKHQEFYHDRAINSAYLTSGEFLNESERQVLFRFLGSTKVMNVVREVIPQQPCFMNTQLFFDPHKSKQKNYWHRDPQYHLSLQEQEKVLESSSEVIHLRLPLLDEPGLELVPGSHKRWDSEEELEVRMQLNGRQDHDDLSSGVEVPLAAGDLLVFSANMIHRGLYGMDRLALDMLFCSSEPDLVQFVRDDCLPSSELRGQLEDATAFDNVLRVKSQMG